MKKIISAMALMLVASCSAAEDKSISERASADEVIMVANDDADMDKAFVKAKTQLDTFLEAWRNPPAGTADFSVKVGISEGETTEYFWIASLHEESGSFFGRVS
ncbi:MAG: hypothetical protein ACREO2_10375, partial [Arenimonas sp.]